MTSVLKLNFFVKHFNAWEWVRIKQCKCPPLLYCKCPPVMDGWMDGWIKRDFHLIPCYILHIQQLMLN